MSNLFNIGTSGMRNAQLQLAMTSNNMSNMQTEGYTRQKVDTTSAPMSGGSVRVGNGVFTSGIQREFESGLNDQMNQSFSKQASYQSLHDGISTLNEVFGSSDVSLDKHINQFFSAAADVAQDPSSQPARQTLLGNAESLVNQFHSMSSQLENIEKNTDASINSNVDRINDYAKRIGSLNEEITKTRAQSGAEPSDLMDTRDQAVTELSRLTGVNVTAQNGDQYNVTMSDGTSLVAGDEAFSISADNASNFKGGALGGLVEFRQGTLGEMRGNLDSLAYTVATETNRVQTQGFDLNGQQGNALFSVPANESGSASRVSVAIKDPREIAAASESDSGKKDNRNALAIADLKNQRFDVAGSQSTFSEAYSRTVSRVGTAENDASARLKAQSNVSDALKQKQQSVSGVNLDEEVANMQQQQAFYKANARIIQTANTMMDTLLSIR